MVCNVVTYRARSASREVAKALGFRAETIDRMAKSIDQYHVDPRGMPTSAQHPAYHHTDRASEHGWEEPRAMPDTVGDLLETFDEKERARFPLFRELTLAIADFPRHLSIHNGGMLITALPPVDTVPIERATMPDRNVVQFDKRDVEDLGLVKMDLLGLRTLSRVQDAHPLLEPILKETLGVILFQEQILRVAIAAAGFSPSAADMLRRAMSRARSSADMEKLRGPFVSGAREKGVDDVTASEIFRQIAAFAEFGLCKRHAAALPLTAYHTAHPNRYYPAERYSGSANATASHLPNPTSSNTKIS